MSARKLKIIYRALDALVPYARNSRTHSDAQIAQIGASILEYGWTNPLLCDEHGGIIAGHGRVLAARWLLEHHSDKLNEKGLDLTSLPTIELAGLSEAQRTAYVIADNKLALNAGWDFEMLAAEFKRLEELDFNKELTGFSGAEFDKLLADLTPPDETQDEWEGMPEFSPEPRSYRSIRVHFQDEASLRDFEELIGQTISAKAKYIWHPAKDKEDLSETRWVDDDGGDDGDDDQDGELDDDGDRAEA